MFAALWQNPTNPLDVDNSGIVVAKDVLAIINRIERHRDGVLPDVKSDGQPFYDCNGDGLATALDALVIINALAGYQNPMTLVSGISAEFDPDANGVQLTDTTRFVGSTIANSQIDVLVFGNIVGSADSDSFGNYFVDVPLAVGRNDFTVTATDRLGRTETVARVVQRADAVVNWNATILNVVREWTTTSDDPFVGRIVTSPPPMVARNMAMIHTAMFDAANAFDGEYESYLGELAAPQNGSPAAALSAAALRVASSIYSDTDELAYWNAAYAEAMSEIPDGPAKQSGIEFGASVGDAMLASRASDGSQITVTYEVADEPGFWNRTLPGFLPPLLPQWPNVDPFAIDSIDDYLPDPPPDLITEEYAASVDEVLRLGRLDSNERTADQTEIALFWADGGGTATPPGHWNRIASDVLIGQSNSLIENARTFALLNLAMADAGIAAWNAKYTYELWRPIDAIRYADLDDNDDTFADDDWLPLLVTPPFPTYTSGHSTFSGAADAVLSSLLGSNVAFSSQIDSHSSSGQSPLDPSELTTRSFTSFSQAADEAGLSRIYGGIHFDFDNTAGLAVGRDIGTLVVNTKLGLVI